MRIGISGKILAAKLSGNGYYLYWLLRSLLSIQDSHEYYLLVPGEFNLPSGLQPGERFHVCRPRVSMNRRGLRAGFEMAYVPFLSGRMGLDLLHMPTDGGAYWAPGGKLVVSLMGIAARHFPHIHRPHIRVLQRWNMALSARRADLVLTISQSSKRDIVEMFGVHPDKVRVTYLGVSPDFTPKPRASTQADAIRAKYRLPGRYILYVGNLEPRKNITSLIAAFGSLVQREDVDLVVVGRKAWLYDAVFETAVKSGYDQRIHFTDYADLADLPWIYSLAEVFVFPSLFEGFGLPNLEAMSCGTPVISSNTSAVPEVVGDAGLLIDPTDIAQIAAAITHVLSDKGLAEHLRSAGIQRATQFTWHRTAVETIDAYQSLAH
jgi:glycosyltransferase involved in cell wall biosynthesis